MPRRPRRLRPTRLSNDPRVAPPPAIQLWDAWLVVGPGWRKILTDTWISIAACNRSRVNMGREPARVIALQHLGGTLALELWPWHCGAAECITRVAYVSSITCEQCGEPGRQLVDPQTDAMTSSPSPVVRCPCCWRREREGHLAPPHTQPLGAEEQEFFDALTRGDRHRAVNSGVIIPGIPNQAESWRPDPDYDRPWRPGVDQEDDHRDGLDEREPWQRQRLSTRGHESLGPAVTDRPRTSRAVRDRGI